jgi:hypothetical protein
MPLYIECIKTVGYGESFTETWDFPVSGISPEQLAQSEISIYLVDSLGTVYRNTTTSRSGSYAKAAI